jgi:hypothetical protein
LVVTGAIPLEGHSGSVGLPAVEFGDETCRAPEKVHDETDDEHVHLRQRKTMSTKER